MRSVYEKLMCLALCALLGIQIALFRSPDGGVLGVSMSESAEAQSSSSGTQRREIGKRVGANERSLMMNQDDGQLYAWEVKNQDTDGHLLLSEMLGSDSPRRHAASFVITNTGSDVLHFTVGSPSCGCLGFEKDGARLAVGDLWDIPARSAAVIAASFPLEARRGSVERGFDLAQLREGRVARRRRLIWRVEVHEDLTVDPPLLNCAHRAGVPAPSDLSLSITVCSSKEAANTVPRLQLPNDSWLTLEAMSPHGETEGLDDRLHCRRFRASLKVDESRLREMVAAGSATCEMQARVVSAAAAKTPSVTVPIAIRDAAILDAPASIHFGTVRVGKTVNRCVLLASRDGGDFSLREASSASPSQVEVTLSERIARYQMVMVSFTPKSAGQQDGKLTLIPATENYRPTTVAFHALVIDAQTDDATFDKERSQL